MKSNNFYNPKELIKNLWLFALMVVVMKATTGNGFIIFVVMTFAAVMQSRVKKFVVLMMIASCALIGNNVLMPKSTLFSIEQKVMIVMLSFVLVAKIAGRRQASLLIPLKGILPYVLFMCVSSAFGWSPLISFLKLFLFSTCYFAYYSMANLVISDNSVEIKSIRSAYLSLCCFMVFGSVFLIPFPGLSQMSLEAYEEAIRAGQNITSLFAGMAFHSQAFGPMIAVITTLLVSDLLFGIRKADKLVIALLLCCPFLIYKTSSRTALGTALAGCLFAVYLFMNSRSVGIQWKGKVMSMMIMIVIVASAALCCSSSGRTELMRFVIKHKGASEASVADLTKENILYSRQDLMDSAMYNFRKSPVIGNGFQVSEAHIGAGRLGLKSILSAPIEKGVWVTAVLEEGGVVGFALFVGFGICALVALTRRKAYCCASVFLAIFILNLGEFTFFSMSGIGGFYWFLCFLGAVMDGARMKQKSLALKPQGRFCPAPNNRCSQ